MSFGGDLTTISVQKFQSLESDIHALCRFLRHEAEEQPTMQFSIDDTWDILRACLEKLGQAQALAGVQLKTLPCAEFAFYISPELIASTAPQLAVHTHEQLETLVENLDYEDLYHGETWGDEEGRADFLDLLIEFIDFYQEVAQTGEAMIYLLT